jgi:ABC-type nickel/cobalt efflux system permease component RcnA
MFVGNRTECALLMLLRKWGIDYKQVHEAHEKSLFRVGGVTLQGHAKAYKRKHRAKTSCYHSHGCITCPTDNRRSGKQTDQGGFGTQHFLCCSCVPPCPAAVWVLLRAQDVVLHPQGAVPVCGLQQGCRWVLVLL